MAFIDSPKKLISRHNKRNSALATNVPGHTRRMEASLISHKYPWGALGILGDPGAASWEDAMFRATDIFGRKFTSRTFAWKYRVTWKHHVGWLWVFTASLVVQSGEACPAINYISKKDHLSLTKCYRHSRPASVIIYVENPACFWAKEYFILKYHNYIYLSIVELWKFLNKDLFDHVWISHHQERLTENINSKQQQKNHILNLQCFLKC